MLIFLFTANKRIVERNVARTNFLPIALVERVSLLYEHIKLDRKNWTE